MQAYLRIRIYITATQIYMPTLKKLYSICNPTCSLQLIVVHAHAAQACVQRYRDLTCVHVWFMENIHVYSILSALSSLKKKLQTIIKLRENCLKDKSNKIFLYFMVYFVTYICTADILKFRSIIYRLTGKILSISIELYSHSTY